MATTPISSLISGAPVTAPGRRSRHGWCARARAEIGSGLVAGARWLRTAIAHRRYTRARSFRKATDDRHFVASRSHRPHRLLFATHAVIVRYPDRHSANRI